MVEITDTEDKGRCAGGGRTLSLRGGGATTIRQNFSHGRSKPVIVERRRRRAVVQVGSEGEGSGEREPPSSKAPLPVREKPPVRSRGRGEHRSWKSSQGDTRQRSLTEEEKGARARALADAQEREEGERARFAQEERARQERVREEAARMAEKAVSAALEEEVSAPPVGSPSLAKSEAPEILAPGPVDVPRKGADSFEEKVGGDKRFSARPRKGLSDSKSFPDFSAKPPVKPAARLEERRRSRLTISNALNEDGERSRSMASIRRQRERVRKRSREGAVQQKISREVVIPETISVQDLSGRMAERASSVVKFLFGQGQIVKVTDIIDADLAQLIAEEMGHTVRRVSDADVEEGLFAGDDDESLLVPRPPVVTVMGHVDHGKTSLLDALRQSDVAAGEVGGITQHIGAYQVDTGQGLVTFIDTPGHAAFTQMRERGAKVTDIVVLVVAADDGVMPQTVEAISHAKAASVPLIVAINKIDRPGADPSRARLDLLQHGVVVESMGGEVVDVEVSALEKRNVGKLLEMILLQAELLDLKANPDGPASGFVIEARLDKGRGPVATLLVSRGRLAVGDIVVAGSEWGKVRNLANDKGVVQAGSGPSCPVEVLGLSGVAEAGDRFVVVENEVRAKDVTGYRRRQKRDQQAIRAMRERGSLEQMMNQIRVGEGERVSVIVKGDARGSVEAVVAALEGLSSEEVGVRILHAGVGSITETDVSLASASGTVILGFNVRANKQACEMASQKGVAICCYNIVYELIDHVKRIMSGLLSPERLETFLGRAEILEVFDITKTGKIAGCRVVEGKVERGAFTRLLRRGVTVYEGELSTLRRFKDEVKEVVSGQECGMSFEGCRDIQAGDVVECFRVQEVQRSL